MPLNLAQLTALGDAVMALRELSDLEADERATEERISELEDRAVALRAEADRLDKRASELGDRWTRRENKRRRASQRWRDAMSTFCMAAVPEGGEQ